MKPNEPKRRDRPPGGILIADKEIGMTDNPNSKYFAESCEVSDAIQEHPEDVVGFTLLDLKSTSVQAMVLDTKTKKSYRVLTALDLVGADSEFAEWLPSPTGQKLAIVQVGFKLWDGATVWRDEYIVDLVSGRSFAPTSVNRVGWYNQGLRPYDRGLSVRNL
jgi:hypothetical protein